jgi:glycosyltransferase involved in cell wall biosynthesis
VPVHYDYSRSARRRHHTPLPAAGRRLARTEPRAWYPSENLVPLGAHALDIPHATWAGARLLMRQPVDAILVNADPFAALLVGEQLAQRFGVPWVADLRDPWAGCELRRPLRGVAQQRAIEALEARVVRSAAGVIFNTEAAAAECADRHPDYLRKISVIRNHADPELIASKPRHPVRFERFTLLFAGTLRRHVEGGPLLALLATLRQRGIGPERLALALPSDAASQLQQRARARGLEAYLEGFDHVSYTRLEALMDAADVLVALGHPGHQRIPAKIYDYLQSARPIVALSNNPEVGEVMRHADGATWAGLSDPHAAADFVEAWLQRGRHPRVERAPSHTSAEATRALDVVLRQAVEWPERHSPRWVPPVPIHA